jgi:hypothetical protein
MQTRIPLGKVRHPVLSVRKSSGGADHELDEDGHGHHEEFSGRPDMAFPPSPSHTHRGASHSPVLQETSSSSSWIRIPRCRLRILLDRGRMGRRCLRVSRAS